MQIDLANWFEIFAAIIALICWIIKPLHSTAVLAIMLIITVAIEFTSKYFTQQYLATHVKEYVYAKVSLYSVVYNTIVVCGFSGVIYFLLKDKKYKRQYLLICGVVIAFVITNLLLGQGYKVYNNYSTVFCWMLLVGFTLYKLRTFNEERFSKRQNFIVLLFLLTTVAYFTLNLPFFVFFHQMFAESNNKGVQLYRLINDGANYPLYVILALIAILSSLKERQPNDYST